MGVAVLVLNLVTVGAGVGLVDDLVGDFPGWADGDGLARSGSARAAGAHTLTVSASELATASPASRTARMPRLPRERADQCRTLDDRRDDRFQSRSFRADGPLASVIVAHHD